MAADLIVLEVSFQISTDVELYMNFALCSRLVFKVFDISIWCHTTTLINQTCVLNAYLLYWIREALLHVIFIVMLVVPSSHAVLH